jgi:hypothetical protein
MVYDRGPEQLQEEKEANQQAMLQLQQRLNGRLPKAKPRPWWRFWDEGSPARLRPNGSIDAGNAD